MKNDKLTQHIEDTVREFDKKFEATGLKGGEHRHYEIDEDGVAIKQFLTKAINKTAEVVRGELKRKEMHWLNCSEHFTDTPIAVLQKCKRCEWEPVELEIRGYNQAVDDLQAMQDKI